MTLNSLSPFSRNSATTPTLFAACLSLSPTSSKWHLDWSSFRRSPTSTSVCPSFDCKLYSDASSVAPSPAAKASSSWLEGFLLPNRSHATSNPSHPL
ncbi:hypothetical protein BCR35DRAFT_305006 [Leucosporidium creatinivorum]|uniref:Uncharacterized protein n=1 Tax=Leucosporidium creatinivorum TaxID=106004 RepID=A0A1Y2F3J3_9BASI|nr:hypothetical protein BCR35DRAFT_305006 [Leucosporidium creatinivorum]